MGARHKHGVYANRAFWMIYQAVRRSARICIILGFALNAVLGLRIPITGILYSDRRPDVSVQHP
jgi:hypothetical protein